MFWLPKSLLAIPVASENLAFILCMCQCCYIWVLLYLRQSPGDPGLGVRSFPAVGDAPEKLSVEPSYGGSASEILLYSALTRSVISAGVSVIVISNYTSKNKGRFFRTSSERGCSPCPSGIKIVQVINSGGSWLNAIMWQVLSFCPMKSSNAWI